LSAGPRVKPDGNRSRRAGVGTDGCQDGHMGSAGDKPRKKKAPLPKVPKYENPNRAEGSDGGSFGRSGHGSDHHHYEKPTGAGAWFLKVLSRKPKP